MKSRVRRRLGHRFRHWGDIPPPRLPEALERLDPRLQGLPENALVRLIMFNNGLRTADEAGSMPAGIRRVAGMIAGVLNLSARTVQWIAGKSAGMFSVPVNPYDVPVLDVIESRMFEIRLAPLTPHDYALAQWGGMLLGSRFWRRHPASALYICSRMMLFKLEAESGWSYYPGMFDHGPVDDVAKDATPYMGENTPVLAGLGDEFKIAPDTFDFRRRLDFLADLWREYLDVWRPDHPLEGEIRRAMRPTRFHQELDARIQDSK